MTGYAYFFLHNNLKKKKTHIQKGLFIMLHAKLLMRGVNIKIKMFNSEKNIWRDRLEELEELKALNLNQKIIASFSKRYNQALISPHFLAYLTDSCFYGVKLTDGEKNEALACAKENFGAYFLTLVMKFLGKIYSFQEFLFEPDVVNQISPHD